MGLNRLLHETLRLLDNPPEVPERQIFNLDTMNIQIAARASWQMKEMGGLEHVQFAFRNDTPIVPPGHPAHPIELVKRGFIDGRGWAVSTEPKITLHQWPLGNHWYAKVDGVDVEVDGQSKWNTQTAAYDAAKRFNEFLEIGEK